MARLHKEAIHMREVLNPASIAARNANSDWTTRLAVPGSRYMA
jgi:hypothetical protein